MRKKAKNHLLARAFFGAATARKRSAIGIFLLASAASAAGPLTSLVPATQNLSTQVTTTFNPSPIVLAYDAANTLLTGISVTFTTPSSGPSGTFSNGTHSITVVSSNGQAGAVLTANSQNGTYTVTAAALGANFQIVNASITVTNLGPTVLFPTASQNATLIGNNYHIVLDATLTDQAGHYLPGYVITFAVPSSGPSGLFDPNQSTSYSGTTDSGGYTHVSFTPNNLVGPYTVNVSVLTPALTILTATIPLANIGPPVSVTPVPGTTPQTRVSSFGFSALAVTVTDSANQPVPAAAVIYQVIPAGAGFTQPANFDPVLTDQNGIAFVNVQAGFTVGSYRVIASSGQATTATFNLTNTAIPATITPLPGTTPQSAPVGTAFQPLVVKLRDKANNPLSGYQVYFIAPNSGATATVGGFPVVQLLTDSNGNATALYQANPVTGSYTVTATALISGITASFALTNTAAVIAPAVTLNPANAAVNAAATAQFTATASGSPSPTIQWQQSTDGGATFSNLTGAISSPLSFPASTAQDGYRFRAVFTNGTGIATTTAATLTVHSAPAVTQNPSNVTVSAGASAQFTAAAAGNPTPTVQWQQSTDSGNVFTNVAGATTTTFSFTAAWVQNGYQFRAVFINSNGSATTTAATLNVQLGCDLNSDGHTNISDIQLVVDQALGKAHAVNDLTHDGVVNVVDVQNSLGCVTTNGTLPASTARPLPLPSGGVTASAVSRNANFDPSSLSFHVTELGAVEGLSAAAYGINNLGQVVGASQPVCASRLCASRAFLWEAGRMTNLGVAVDGEPAESAAFSINDSGQIAGNYWYPGQAGSFLYTSGHIALLKVAQGSGVSAINNAGQIAGDFSRATTPSSAAFLWKAGSMTAVETLGGSGAHASAINDVGQVVGFASVRDNSARHAFLYDGVASTDLGTLGGTDSFAFGINVVGQVVGSSQTIDDRRQHAFLYSRGLMTDLGTLGGGDSQADGINSRGLIVGWARTSSGDQHAFLWSAGRMLDLNSLAGLGADTMLLEATAINDVGQLVANGSNGRAYLIVLPDQLR